MCTVKTTAHSGSSRSGVAESGMWLKGGALRWVKGSASIMDEPPV